MSITVRCKRDSHHVWFSGVVSEWCSRCWLVVPHDERNRDLRPKRRPATKPKSDTRACVIERDGRRCHYCGCIVIERSQTEKLQQNTLTIDHKVPRSRGGTNHPDNLVVACFQCNHAKGDLPYPKAEEPQ